MYCQNLEIIDAFQNNLKNISLTIPKHKWIAVTGVSGSGKSTLVFDVIYAQAQKEFLESLSAYARRSFPKTGDVNVQRIEGLSPSIVIDQSSFPNTPRSTVGTYTDIYTYLRLLFSRAGDMVLSSADFSFNSPRGACPVCSGLGEALQPNLGKLLQMDKSLNEGAIQHKTWKVGSRYWNIIRAIGYFDMDKPLKDFTPEEMDKLLYCPPFVYQNDEPGHVQSFSYEGIISRLRKRKSDNRGLSATEYDDQFFVNGVCPECNGSRINRTARNVRLSNGYTMEACVNMELQDLYAMLSELHGPVEDALVPILLKSLKNLLSVGMGYITLNRSASTLSGGEAQKVKLAKALGCSLTDIIYILDEPTAGMHPHDIHRIQRIIRDLVLRGNTVITISHNRDIIRAADYIIDMGPGAGKYGGEVLYNGIASAFQGCAGSETAKHLFRAAALPKSQTRKAKGVIALRDITANNLNHLDVDIPKGVLTCITGVSGAGKSTLSEELIRMFPKAVVAEQDTIGTTVRGNAGTYTKVFDDIRKYFSTHTMHSASDFSFNSTGSCEACNGLGYIVTDMHFIGDIHTPCEACGGRRYKQSILVSKVRGNNIADVLDMTITEAIRYFEYEPAILRKLELLESVGLDYITLGQPLSTLSGGELQRLKLADRIQEKGNLYIFDEPTRGLHFKDVDLLMRVLNQLVDRGNTVVVVEHNLDVIAQADHIIDMGPSGGKAGGKILFEGNPSALLQCPDSYTSQCLRTNLNR